MRGRTAVRDPVSDVASSHLMREPPQCPLPHPSRRAGTRRSNSSSTESAEPPPGHARRPQDRADHRRPDRRRVPAHRGRRRRGAPRAVRRTPGPGGVLLVQPHLRRRHPRVMAAAPALHGRQPRALDAPARPGRTPARPALRGPRPARRPRPHRPAHRRRLRGRARPDGLAVRRRPRLRRLRLLAGLPLRRARRLVVRARPPPRRRRPRPGRPRRPALVPVQPDLDRVRGPAPAHRLRHAGGAAGHRHRRPGLPRRPRTPRILVRPPARRPAQGRPHRRRLLTVAAALVTAAARHDTAAPGAGAVLGRILQAAVAAFAVVVLWVVCRRGRSENRLDLRLERALVSWLPGASLALLLVTVLYAGWSRPGWVSSGTLPGDAVFSALTVAQGALVVALGAVALLLRRPCRDPRTALYGLGGPAVAMLACALGGIMSGGVAQRVADWLDGPATPGMGDPGPRISPPVLLSWQASVIPVLLLLLAVPAALLAARTLLAARRLRSEVEADYATGDERDPVRTGRIATVRARAALTDSAPVLVGVVSGATLFSGPPPSSAPGPAGTCRAGPSTAPTPRSPPWPPPPRPSAPG